MKAKTESTPLRFARSLAIGVLLSMVFFYSVHVFGTWTVEQYRPDPETTSTTLLHNECAIFGKIHTMSPTMDIASIGDGIDGNKLGASFLNFIDGHVLGMIVLALLSGSIIFLIRNIKKRKEKSSSLV